MDDQQHQNEAADGRSDLTAVLGVHAKAAHLAEMESEAIRITGLSEVLCIQSSEELNGSGSFGDAQNLAWSYQCLAKLANDLAQKFSDLAP